MANKFRVEQLSYSLVNGKENQYFLSLNGRRYYVGQFVIEILELLQKQRSYQEIALELNKNHDTDFFSESSIQQTVEVDFVQQGMLSDGTDEDKVADGYQQYIYGRINFLKPSRFPQILNTLSYLFTPVLFIGISVLSTIFTVFFLTQEYEVIIHAETYSLQILLLFFAFSIINTFWHEVGHATAAHRFGVAPKDIGFGFYIVYPIFFTDVSDIWQLNKNQRNIVNLGGIYFQMIVNLLLISLYHILPSFWIAPALVAFNTGVALVSLNPFFRYDGYWVYSDSFNLTNLRSRSNLYVKSLFQKIMGKETKSWKELLSTPKSLILYSITSTIFFIIIFTLLGWGFVSQIKTITEIVKNANLEGWSKDIVWSIFTKAITIVMLPVFIIWTFAKRKK
ncbi:MAG: hypothetical protein E6772_07280 [Dysgonomonas sp.]|nr:hypothetical protein [Dysgonomonas sp.]